MDEQSTFVDLYGSRIVSRIDPMAGQKEALERNIRARIKATGVDEPIPPHDGWIHDWFDLTDGTPGEHLGQFPTLGLALAAAKKRNPPPPLPKDDE